MSANIAKWTGYRGTRLILVSCRAPENVYAYRCQVCYTGVVAKAALGTSFSKVCKQEEAPCPLDVLPIRRESCHRGEWAVLAGGPSTAAAGLHAHSSRTRHFLRAQRHSSKSQGHRPEEGPAPLRKRAWKMGWCWLYGSSVRLRNDSASFLYTLHIHYSSWRQQYRSWSPRSPLLDLSATWRQTPGLLKAPAQHSASTAAGGARSRGGLSPFSSSPPNKEKAKRVWALTRAQGSESIGVESIAHAEKAGERNGTMLRKNHSSYNSYTWNRSTKMMMTFLLLQPCIFSHFSVGGVGPVSSMLEVSQMVVCVFLSPREWRQWGQSRCGSPVFLLPPKVIKEKEKENLIIASALSRIYGRLSKFSGQKRFKKIQH